MTSLFLPVNQSTPRSDGPWMRSSFSDSWPSGARNRLVVILFVSSEDKMRQVEDLDVPDASLSSQWCGFTRLSMNYLWSQWWLKNVSLQTPPPPFDICEKHDMETSVFGILCICWAFLHLYTRSRFFDMWSETFNRRFLAEMGKCLSALCKLSADTCKKKTYGVPEAQSRLAVLCYRLREMLSVYTVGSRSVL